MDCKLWQRNYLFTWLIGKKRGKERRADCRAEVPSQGQVLGTNRFLSPKGKGIAGAED